MLRISIDTLNRWRRNNNIRFPCPLQVKGKFGKTLWVESDIEKWIKSNK